MIQDTAHYYLVSYLERAVGIEKKMIFRSFKEIQTLIERLRTPISVELVDCADFNKQGTSFAEWKVSQEAQKAPVPDKIAGSRQEVQEEPINALDGLKIKKKESKEIDAENHVGLSNKECFHEDQKEPMPAKPRIGREMSQEEPINALEGLKIKKD